MRLESEMPTTLEDFLRHCGCPSTLICNNSKVHLSSAVRTLLRFYHTPMYNNEPGYPNQEPAKRRIQDFIRMRDNLMTDTNTPAAYWVLASQLCQKILNVLFNASHNKSPHEAAFGQRLEILPFLQ